VEPSRYARCSRCRLFGEAPVSGANVQSGQRVAHVPAGDGMRLWVPETLPDPFADGEGPFMSQYTLVATSPLTAGSLTVLNIVVPPGNGPPPHRHVGSDESVFVLDGSFTVTAGGQEFAVALGDYAFIPRGTEHSWRNTSGRTARMLVLCIPSDMEEFFKEAGRPIQSGEEAERLTQEDVRRAEAAQQKFGLPPVSGY